MKLAELLAAEKLRDGLKKRGLKERAATDKIGLLAQAARALVEGGAAETAQARAFFVPGRIEVLGKHTDYAGGRSIVTAVEQGFCMVATERQDAAISVTAAALEERVEFAFEPELATRHGHWSNYPMTVARRLARNFSAARRGADIAFASDLPPASGMSSSSAMMVATYLVLGAINELEKEERYQRNIPDPLTLAAYLGTVENGQSFGELAGDKGVGTFGGSEDHTAILCSQAGRLGQFSYCPARFERYIDVPEGYRFAVAFSGVVAEKTGAAQELYNRASQRVSVAVEAWRQATGRDQVYLADVLASGPDAADELRRILTRVSSTPFSGAELVQRLDHFFAENEEIVAPAGDALATGDLQEFGRLVERSQELTESLLQNQVPQTVELARLARQCGAAAASAFGAGFGGSVWALVTETGVEEFLKKWSIGYAEKFTEAALRARFFTTQAGPAAFELGR